MDIDIREKNVTHANALRVAAGTNGYKGGDSGHGSRTVFEIEDAGGSDVEASVKKNGRSVRIELGGDSELSTFIEALEFALSTLREQAE